MRRSQRMHDMEGGPPAALSLPLIKEIARRIWEHGVQTGDTPAVFAIVLQAQYDGPPEEMRTVSGAVADLPSVVRACESLLSRVEAISEERQDRALVFALAALRNYIARQTR